MHLRQIAPLSQHEQQDRDRSPARHMWCTGMEGTDASLEADEEADAMPADLTGEEGPLSAGASDDAFCLDLAAPDYWLTRA